jgi:predicted RNA-binding protein YlqC (UPF0109 family)
MIDLAELNDTTEDVESMRSLMEGIVIALVDAKDNVVVKAVCSATGVAIVISVAAEDLGRVIGQEGRTIRSLRTILLAASKKFGLACSLDLKE